ncbi:MAG: dUTP diphosphatase [Candidatus Eisenbacteria bacterium]|nr:dUTP diphosphatase [Candidatus Eisenbacteria bacterium]
MREEGSQPGTTTSGNVGTVDLEIVRLPNLGDLPLPRYMSDGASGMDLRAAVESVLSLEPGERTLVPTGVAVAVPTGYEGQVRPRSGLAHKRGVTVLNAPGTIDSDYRGEIKVILANLGEETVNVERGDRIAQLVIAPVVRARWAERRALAETPRNDGGFGHTG